MSFVDLGARRAHLACPRSRRLHHPHPHPIADHSARARRSRSARLCPNRHGQNRGLRAADFAIASISTAAPPHRGAARRRAGPHPRTGFANRQSFATYGRNLHFRHAVIFGGVGQGPQVRALQPRRPHSCRHAGPAVGFNVEQGSSVSISSKSSSSTKPTACSTWASCPT